MTWTPLLEGELARLAEAALERIVEGLPRIDQEEVERGAEQPLYSRGLGGGVAGQTLFWAYLARCADHPSAVERALACLDRAIDELADTEMDASLYGGITGVGWVGQHLSGFLFEADDEDDPLDEIDQALLDHLGRRPWRGQFDLVSGLAGFGVYALERLPRPAARQAAEQIVLLLEEQAVARAIGLTWRTRPEFLPPHQLDICPRGCDNLGVAHGVPAVIAFLAAAHQAGIATATTRSLLEGAVSWLLSTQLEQAGSLFPSFVCDERPPEPSRLAWCYGDPGVAATLLFAARCLGQRGWEEEALKVARAAAARTLETTGVLDHGLCHGSTGLGHLFNRIYQATGDGLCADAARFWFRHALVEIPAGEWQTGFPTSRPHPDGNMGEVEETAMLTGVSGVGLALLAATKAVSPDWDRALLVAIPPTLSSKLDAA